MSTTAKLFRNGRSQAVRLPREFRFEGDPVRVRRVGRGVLVEPVFANVADWFARLIASARSHSWPMGGINRAHPSERSSSRDISPRHELVHCPPQWNAAGRTPPVSRAITKEVTVLVSSVVAFELWYGFAKSQHTEANTQRLSGEFERVAGLKWEDWATPRR